LDKGGGAEANLLKSTVRSSSYVLIGTLSESIIKVSLIPRKLLYENQALCLVEARVYTIEFLKLPLE